MYTDPDELRAVVRSGTDRVDTFLAHFSQPDATWENFGKSQFYIEHLRLDLMALLLHTEQELQRQASSTIEPTDFGV